MTQKLYIIIECQKVLVAYQGGEGGSEVQLEEEKEQVVAEWHLEKGQVV